MSQPHSPTHNRSDSDNTNSTNNNPSNTPNSQLITNLIKRNTTATGAKHQLNQHGPTPAFATASIKINSSNNNNNNKNTSNSQTNTPTPINFADVNNTAAAAAAIAASTITTVPIFSPISSSMSNLSIASTVNNSPASSLLGPDSRKSSFTSFSLNGYSSRKNTDPTNMNSSNHLNQQNNQQQQLIQNNMYNDIDNSINSIQLQLQIQMRMNNNNTIIDNTNIDSNNGRGSLITNPHIMNHNNNNNNNNINTKSASTPTSPMMSSLTDPSVLPITGLSSHHLNSINSALINNRLTLTPPTQSRSIGSTTDNNGNNNNNNNSSIIHQSNNNRHSFTLPKPAQRRGSHSNDIGHDSLKARSLALPYSRLSRPLHPQGRLSDTSNLRDVLQHRFIENNINNNYTNTNTSTAAALNEFESSHSQFISPIQNRTQPVMIATAPAALINSNNNNNNNNNYPITPIPFSLNGINNSNIPIPDLISTELNFQNSPSKLFSMKSVPRTPTPSKATRRLSADSLADQTLFHFQSNNSNSNNTNNNNNNNITSNSNNNNSIDPLVNIHYPPIHSIDFEFESIIGDGAFGLVYRARHKSDNSILAIKKYKSKFESTSARNRLLNRLKNLTIMQSQYKSTNNNDINWHPHLLRHYSIWQEDNGRLFISTELCNGDLSVLIHANYQIAYPQSQSNNNNNRLDIDNPMNPIIQSQSQPAAATAASTTTASTELFYNELEVWRVLSEIGSALSFLHSISIVHLDVKPANCLLLNDNSYSYRLGDLDSCVRYNDSRYDSINGGDEFSDGHYLAPELLNHSIITPAADIYSFGLTLYAMATGTLVKKDDNGQIELDWNKAFFPITNELKSILIAMTQYSMQNRPKMAELVSKAQSVLQQTNYQPRFNQNLFNQYSIPLAPSQSIYTAANNIQPDFYNNNNTNMIDSH